jgi:hypothetical protein
MVYMQPLYITKVTYTFCLSLREATSIWSWWDTVLVNDRHWIEQWENSEGEDAWRVSTGTGRAIAPAVSRRLPTAAARFCARAEHVEFVEDKVALGQVFSEYLVSPANYHSTKFCIVIIAWGLHSSLIGSCSAEWTQLDSTPTLKLKK